nr:hypothetical protein [Lachnospiraceae bacterium]
MWSFDTNYSFSNKNFAKIYQFYVVETPVENTSMRGKTFNSRSCNVLKLYHELIKKSPFLKDHWHVSTIAEMPVMIKERGLEDTPDYRIECVIHTNNKNSITVSLFYSIRCALAHGAFETRRHDGIKYYLLENRDKNVIKGRMVVKENTLLDWIRIVESLSE